MIITCKACNASFNLNESLLKPEGSKVRCSKCKKVFMAYPPAPPEEAKKPDEMLSGLDLELEQETKDSETGQLDDSEFGELDLPDLEKLFAKETAGPLLDKHRIPVDAVKELLADNTEKN